MESKISEANSIRQLTDAFDLSKIKSKVKVDLLSL